MSKKKESKKVDKEPVVKKYTGPTRSFRFRNPVDHMDKYRWFTLKSGDSIPKEIQTILDEEAQVKKSEERLKEFEADLADDGKRNNSQNKDKKSPGRKSDKEKK